MTRKGTIFTPVALAAVLALAACARQVEPVGGLEARPDSLSIAYPAFARVELAWDMRQELAGREGDLRVFVHLLDGEGNLERTFDHALAEPWQAGRHQSYSIYVYQSALAPPLEAGTYRLTAGLYDAAGNRWPLATPGPEVADGEYEVARVEVSEEAGAFPMFYFSSAWLPVEGGSDRQVLGRRWLTENGVIRLGDLAAGGVLWLIAGIPSPSGSSQEIVFTGDEQLQKLAIVSSCGDFQAEITGAGSHAIEIPISPSADGTGECEISFETNYHLRSTTSGDQRTIALEVLSWSGA